MQLERHDCGLQRYVGNSLETRGKARDCGLRHVGNAGLVWSVLSLVLAMVLKGQKCPTVQARQDVEPVAGEGVYAPVPVLQNM